MKIVNVFKIADGNSENVHIKSHAQVDFQLFCQNKIPLPVNPLVSGYTSRSRANGDYDIIKTYTF